MAADIEIVIGAEDRASAVLNNVAAKAGGFSTSLAALGPIAIGVGAAIGAVTAAFSALNGVISGIADSANKIDVLYDKARGLGESVGDLQAFQLAMKEAGNVDAEASITALQKISRVIGEVAGGGGDAAKGVFEKLGLDAAKLSLDGPVDQFLAVKNAIGNVENISERAALAQQLLGKSAANLIPALIAEQEGFEASMKAAADLGGVVSNIGASGIAAMNDAVGRVSVGFEGIYNQMAVAIAPAIEVIATEIAKWLPPIIKLADTYLPTIVDAIAVIAGGIYDIGRADLAILTLDIEKLSEALQFDTGAENLKAVQAARQRAAEDAIKNEELANASRLAGINDESEAVDKLAQKREEIAAKEMAKRVTDSQSVIDGLQREIDVLQLGAVAVKEMENLASAVNEADRERIDALQKQLGLINEQNEALKEEERIAEERDKQILDQAKKDQELAARQNEVAQPLQAKESRLLTRGESSGPLDTLVKESREANAQRKRLEKVAERNAKAAEKLYEAQQQAEAFTVEFAG